MTFCGRNIQSTKLVREIAQYPGSTNPIEIETEAEIGFVKSIQSPMGRDALVRELVAAELGTWLGLKIPAFAIIPSVHIDIRLQKNGRTVSGPMFFSKKVHGMPYDGSGELLASVKDKSDISLLVLFDTWIRNWDRWYDQESNYDNLLFCRRKNSSKYDLVPIDHSEGFQSSTLIEWNHADDICDEGVYGNFPEFEPYLDYEGVHSAVEKLSALEDDFVQAVVESVPSEWLSTLSARGEIADFVLRRAAYIMETFEKQIVGEPPLPGMRL